MFSRHGAPVSIGQYLTLELQARQQTLSQLSETLACPEEHLRQVLDGTEPLTAALALKIERCWGVCMKLLLDLQQEHQQWVASTYQMPGGDTSPEVG
ncbi:hypothetical protein DC3_47390 [Deinococcus cellulosilyticus NBRC 106333 = KACC 11606]|uniref:HTH cro/C1-type domain-containing protein n=2 Tax=Deinococcus cellulosilyticus TaxID=401558 RepID=A0A511N8F2_DEIC1|nr:hypothetical protein DC3_47390 [Deinococcus cellulosilyticus NBRC 106333 = KACC 11606]